MLNKRFCFEEKSISLVLPLLFSSFFFSLLTYSSHFFEWLSFCFVSSCLIFVVGIRATSIFSHRSCLMNINWTRLDSVWNFFFFSYLFLLFDLFKRQDCSISIWWKEDFSSTFSTYEISWLTSHIDKWCDKVIGN